MYPLLLQSYYVTTTRASFKNYVSQEWAHCHIQLLSFLYSIGEQMSEDEGY